MARARLAGIVFYAFGKRCLGAGIWRKAQLGQHALCHANGVANCLFIVDINDLLGAQLPPKLFQALQPGAEPAILLIVQTGTAVNFPNFDTVRHHVYSFSPIKVIDIKLYSGTPTEPVVFDKPGVAALGCNIHDRMSAYVEAMRVAMVR